MIRWIICVSLMLLVGSALVGCASSNRPAQLVGGAGPIYPAMAKEQGIEGSVTVVYDISQEGQVINLVVIESTPAGVFDDAAVAAVLSWRFNPRMEEGQPVAVAGKRSTVTFKLSGADEYEQY